MAEPIVGAGAGTGVVPGAGSGDGLSVSSGEGSEMGELSEVLDDSETILSATAFAKSSVLQADICSKANRVIRSGIDLGFDIQEIVIDALQSTGITRQESQSNTLQRASSTECN